MENIYLRLDHEKTIKAVYRSPSVKPDVAHINRAGRFILFDSAAAMEAGFDTHGVLGKTPSELGWDNSGSFIENTHRVARGGQFVRRIIRWSDGLGGNAARLVQIVPCINGGEIGYSVDISDMQADDFRRIGGDYSERTLVVSDDISLDLKEFLVLDQISQGFSSSHVRKAVRVSAAEFDNICKQLCMKFECNMQWLPYRGTQKGRWFSGCLRAHGAGELIWLYISMHYRRALELALCERSFAVSF